MLFNVGDKVCLKKDIYQNRFCFEKGLEGTITKISDWSLRCVITFENGKNLVVEFEQIEKTKEKIVILDRLSYL